MITIKDLFKTYGKGAKAVRRLAWDQPFDLMKECMVC